MSDKVLIAYASGYGTTREIAERIGVVLRQHGRDVDVTSVKEIGDISAYGAAVIGSPVNFAKWLPEAVDFVQAKQDALAKIPVALFTVYMHAQGDDSISEQTRQTYIDAIRPLVNPVDMAFFTGRTSRQVLDKLMPDVINDLEPPTDFINWESIMTWAAGLAESLK